MGEKMHGGGWTTEMQQWVNLPANVPMVSTYSTTFLEFDDPLRAWSNEIFGPSSSHISNWLAEAAPIYPIKEEGHQQDLEQPLESFSKVPSSLLKNTEGGKCPPFPMLNQSSHLLSCDNSRRRKPSPDSCSISFQQKRPERPMITSHMAPLKVSPQKILYVQSQRTHNCPAVLVFQIRKEKLGDRIATLQQLVSPFGKTDTASVLLDAIEYIKCLQEQLTGYEIKKEMGGKEDLRSRGLCLAPISTICNVGKDTSINSWAPKSGTIYR
ncbi:transcription factor bHLH18-like isoform X2 [Elaeis guineensis]|uniref:transcription factor bHLH18-like isoform X2 n=1 Tax=Elaeis guineensis var. tenera TaxID=51953 RepID=UPI003C6D37C8